MPAPGDGGRPNLWLQSVVHQGADTTTTGSTEWVTDPITNFDGWALPNRVWDVRSGRSMMNRIRLGLIQNSTGASTSIKYLDTDCKTQADTQAIVPETNIKRCFPQWWVPTDPIEPARMDYFNIYPVEKVVTTPSPGVDGSAPVQMEYAYEGNPVWKYAGQKIDTSTGGSKKTWSVLGGWAKVRTTTGNDPGGKNPYTISTYLRGNNGTPSNASGGVRSVNVTASDGTIVPDAPWFAGRVLEKQSYRSSGGAYLDSTITVPWASQDPTAKSKPEHGSVEAYLTGTKATKTTTATSKPGGTRITYQVNSFDALGRIVSTADHGEYGSALTADDTCITTTYAENAAANILSLPAVKSTYAGACLTPSGPLLRSTRTLYDGSTSAVPGTAGYAAPTKGDNTREDIASAVSGLNATTWKIGPTEGYDALGRTIKSTDSSTGTARVTTTAYAPVTGAVTTKTTTNPMGWATTETYDSIRGNTLKTIDPNNNETSKRYDQSGRETASWDARRTQAANPTKPATATSYNVSKTSLSWVKKTIRSGRLDATASYTIYDGMGRERQTQKLSPAGGSIVTDITYDSAGNKNLVRNPYYIAIEPNGVLVTPTVAVPSSTQYSYDTAGRVETERAMVNDNTELWKTQYSYTGTDTTTVIKTAASWSGSPETTITNTNGKTEKRTRYHGTTTTGPADISTYNYDPFDQLTALGDGQNLWTWAYDAAGRETGVATPDAGLQTTTYDAAGRAATRTDAMGTVTGYTYDNIDRVTAQTVTPAGGATKTLISSTYDLEVKGQISSTTRNNGPGVDQPVTTAYSGYDAAYTPGTTKTTLPAQLTGFAGTYTFTNTTTYTGKTDVAGTPAIAGLPAETVSNGYNEFDQPTELIGSASQYVGEATYTQLGQLASFLQNDNNYLSGANSTGRNHITYNWDSGTGRLSSAVATNKPREIALPTDLGTTKYKYDPAGRVTSREQAYPNKASTPIDTQCYSYDHADRVKAVWTPATTTCGTAPAASAGSVSGLGGPAPYAQTYTYTAAGDREQVKRFASNGTLHATETYAYPTPGTPGAHRVQSVTTSTAPTTPQTFTWDAAGRMTSRAGQNLTYTLDGRIDTTAGPTPLSENPNANATAGTPPAPATGAASTGARYYDAKGNLVGITDGTGTTVTLENITAHSTPAGVKTATKTYNFAGKVVAQRTSSNNVSKVAFIISDRVNTSQTITLPSVGTGPVTTLVRRTDPLGLARGANGTATGDAAFAAAPVTTAGTGSNAANTTGFGAVNGYIAGLDDTVSSLTHIGARELDPALGVFTAPDPILVTEKSEGFTPYTYSFGNTTNASDPTGLYQMPICDCEYGGPAPAPSRPTVPLPITAPPAPRITNPAPALPPAPRKTNPAPLPPAPIYIPGNKTAPKPAGPVYPDTSELYATVGVDICLVGCLTASINFGFTGIYLGLGGGGGLRAGAGISGGAGYGQFGQTGNLSVECAGLLGPGLTGGVNLNPFGGYLTGGWGADLGCSMMAVDYIKLN
ncbi:hypothetical protein OHC50_19130 [Paenarthrobacter ilicis]|uniref:hypothetical protein n=1 Tax=Paenarthrobacter ilicis TaxID=43665 RepID=UPI0030095895